MHNLPDLTPPVVLTAAGIATDKKFELKFVVAFFSVLGGVG